MRKATRPQRTFRGIPVREARASMYVQPSQGDIDNATKESPTSCAYALCIKRTLGASSVFVFRSIAYIQALDEAGSAIMERYMVKKYARDYLIRFDGGETVKPGGFVFHKPNRSNTLAYKQKQGAKYYAQGKKSPRTSKGQKQKLKSYSLNHRNGKGCIHLFGADDQIRVRQSL